jgi:hypothetical protein
MFFHFTVFLYSLVYFILIEAASSDRVSNAWGGIFSQHFWLGALIVAMLIGYFYRTAKKMSQRAYMTPIPVIFAASAFGLQYFLTSSIEKNVLALLSAVTYYFIHIALYRLRVYRKDQTARGIIAAGSLSAIFLFYATLFGIYLNFDIPLWILMVVLMLVTTLISFQYFWLVNKDKRLVLNYSLILGLVMAQIAWVMNFWPFGYLTTGVISLIFYYVFWDLTTSHFSGILSKKRVMINMTFFGLLVMAVLISSRWLPVV